MFKLAVLFVWAAVASGKKGLSRDESFVPLLDGKIVGGKTVNITDHPHQVSLLSNGVHECGGSIIGKKHVLTAAHCTDNPNLDDLRIQVGSSEVEMGGTIVKLAKIHRHPKYKGDETSDYDIAILELAEELTFGPTVQIIKLPKANKQVSAGTKVTVTGWGALKKDGSSETKLQSVTVPVASTADCKKLYGKHITKRMFCAGNDRKNGKSVCQGDSGSPLVAGKLLHGIVSWGRGCARPKYLTVYASVAQMRDFIKKVSGI